MFPTNTDTNLLNQSIIGINQQDATLAVLCLLTTTSIEGRTDQRNAQINFSLINLLLFKLLRHVSATQLEPSSGSLKSLQVTSHCSNLLGY